MYTKRVSVLTALLVSSMLSASALAEKSPERVEGGTTAKPVTQEIKSKPGTERKANNLRRTRATELRGQTEYVKQ